VILMLAALSCEPSTIGRGSIQPLSLRQDFFIMYSAIAQREASALVRRYFTRRDYARIESVPETLKVARRRRYVLPTTLRVEWAGTPGLRHWTRKGCGRGTPGMIMYDPERRDLTPVREQDRFVVSVHRAADLVASTGCHAFGLAPGGSFLFGLDAKDCRYELERGFYRAIPWKRIDIVDIQGQRLLSEGCIDEEGIEKYAAAVAFIANFGRRRNPDISVIAQVSFRDNPPSHMLERIARLANIIDGIYFSYPSTHRVIPCRYCSPANLEILLKYLADAQAGSA
jgi:hypothetical protein